jgi:sulfur-oxidizing protein SoxA
MDHFSTIYSGWVFRTDETQAMQWTTSTTRPCIFVDQAMTEFNTVMGSEGNSCASCHTPVEDFEMTRATYPQWDEERGEVQTVEMQVIECQTERMGMEEPYGYDSQAMRNMSALIASEGRGQVVNVAIDGPAQSDVGAGAGDLLHPLRSAGAELCQLPRAELRQQHPCRPPEPGQINGFPTYRLKQANLSRCTTGSAAASATRGPRPFRVGSPEFVALELYVHRRQRPDGRRPRRSQLRQNASAPAPTPGRILRMNTFKI